VNAPGVDPSEKSDQPFQIRRAILADVGRCQQIDVLTERQFADAGHPEFLDGCTIPDGAAARAIDEQRMFVVEVDGRVEGWMFLTRDEGELSIGQLAVHPAQQRLGIGSALLRYVIALAYQAGEQTVVLNTQSDVPWNRPWYERLGFRVVETADWTGTMHAIVAEQSDAGLDWTTRVHMRRHITDTDNSLRTIGFELSSRYGAQAIVPTIDGVLLTEIVQQFERGKKWKPLGGYGGIIPTAYKFGPIDVHYRGGPGAIRPTPVLGCTCGEWGCWPILVTITTSADFVEWTQLHQPHRPDRDYSPMGAFRFSRAQFDQAINDLLDRLTTHPR
jgi:ribosomal protein S18 acetylase RimI-like enzyme